MTSFSQGDEIAKVTKDPVANEGVCFALCMKWLSLALHGKSDEGEGRIKLLKKWVPEAIKLQAHKESVREVLEKQVQDQTKGLTTTLALIQFFGKDHGLKLGKMGSKNSFFLSAGKDLVMLDAVVDEIHEPGTGHMLHFQSASGAHAMATRTRSKGFWYYASASIFIFDPNVSETAVSKDVLKTYLTEYYKAYKYTTLLLFKVEL